MNKQINRRKFLSTLGVTAASSVVLTNPLNAFSNPGKISSFDSEPADIKVTDVKTFKISRAIIIKVETNIGVSGCSPTHIPRPPPRSGRRFAQQLGVMRI